MEACCLKSVQTKAPCQFQRPDLVGSTSNSIWRSKRYAASPPNILRVKKVGCSTNASRIHSCLNVFIFESRGAGNDVNPDWIIAPIAAPKHAAPGAAVGRTGLIRIHI